MSRRKRNVKRLNKSYQSDYINVTRKPRSLIIDPRCGRCRGTGKTKKWPVCPHCRGSGVDPEGDKWFDNHDRVKTTFGPKDDQIPISDNTFMKPIPPTLKIGATVFDNEKGRFETAASSAVNYAYATLPRLKVVEKIEKLTSSLRLTIIERADKFVTIARDSKRHLKMFFVGDKYFFVEEFETYARRSMVYTGTDYALAKAKRPLSIDWVEVLKN